MYKMVLSDKCKVKPQTNMTRPNVETLRERGLICTANKRNGQPCCYKKRPGYDVCAKHGAPAPPHRVTPPPTTCECPVCYEVKPATMLPCKHSLCDDCCEQWFATHTTCPMCRAVVKEVEKRHREDKLRLHMTYDTVVGFLNGVDRFYDGISVRDPAAALRLLRYMDIVHPILANDRHLLVNAVARSASDV